MGGIPPIWAGYPKSYTSGRTRPPQYVVMHYTAGNAGPHSAEDGVAYDKRRTDGVSCHIFADSFGPPLQEVPLGDRAHSAFFYGNAIGVHIEICDTRQTRAQWLDDVSYPTLVNAAGACRWVCDQLGFPLRRLTTAEVYAAYFNPDGQRPKGICDHGAVTHAYGLGDHEDVGVEFPWDVFMDLVTGTSAPTEEADQLFAMKELSNSAVWLTNGLNRRAGITWAAITAMHAAGLIQTPKSGSDSSGFVYVVPDGQIEMYAGPEAHGAASVAFTPEQVAVIAAAAKAGAEAGAPTHAELEQAAFEGAQRAEDS